MQNKDILTLDERTFSIIVREEIKGLLVSESYVVRRGLYLLYGLELKRAVEIIKLVGVHLKKIGLQFHVATTIAAITVTRVD
jgi:hypothetical protein